MNIFRPTRPNFLSTALIAALLTLITPGIAIAEPDEALRKGNPVDLSRFFDFGSSWSIAYDNDVFVPGSRDQDYTFGINLTFTGKDSEDQWASLHGLVDRINGAIGVDQWIEGDLETSKIEYGLFGFTPEDIGVAEPNPDDRPYSSLVYVASTRETYDRESEVSWQSTLTVGLFGLGIIGDIQAGLHAAIDSKDPRGWDNQISDGGEPTFRYSISRQKLLSRIDSHTEIKTTLQASVGYITEAAWSLSIRSGDIHTPWVSFNPELTNYSEKSSPNDFVRVSEQYVWAGISLKLRPYNALLEGQFRDSAVTFDDDEINRGIVEAWLGYTLALSDGYSFTYSLRGHTSEVNRGAADRNVIWGGFLFTKSFS